VAFALLPITSFPFSRRTPYSYDDLSPHSAFNRTGEGDDPSNSSRSSSSSSEDSIDLDQPLLSWREQTRAHPTPTLHIQELVFQQPPNNNNPLLKPDKDKKDEETKLLKILNPNSLIYPQKRET
jgi:hypothetical protein